ncbi:MAG: DUF4625 domain-containing protein [Flavobacteriia bacterium]|nr:DUF4625 domain-containing protein [Flavobacteriia bacterium]
MLNIPWKFSSEDSVYFPGNVRIGTNVSEIYPLHIKSSVYNSVNNELIDWSNVNDTGISIKADGAVLEFIYEFSDDNGLNQFRASVLDNFVDARFQSAPWNYEKDYNLSGTSVIDTLQIALPYPDLEPGRYELTITVQDIDGEETSQKNTFYVIE